MDAPPTRQDSREVDDERVTLTTGLATVHYFIRTGASPETFIESDDHNEVRDVLPGEQTNFSRHTYAGEQWVRVNRSGGGMGIVRAVRPNHAISVGDLIGLREPSRESWSLGVLRWLNVAGDGEYQAGVEFLCQHPRSVELRTEGEISSDAPRILRFAYRTRPTRLGW